MSDSTLSGRPQRKRSTHAVLSDLEVIERWWAPQQPTAQAESFAQKTISRRRHPLQFRSGDPLERLRWVRYGIALISLIIPTILILRLDGAQTVIRRLSFDPRVAAAKSIAQGRPEDAIAPLRLAISNSPNDISLLRQLAQVSAKACPGESRRCYDRIANLNATSDDDRAAHATLLALLHDFRGAKAVLSKVGTTGKSGPTVQRAWLAVWREAGDFASAINTLDQLTQSQGTDSETCLELAESASHTPISPELLIKVEQHLTKALAKDSEAGNLSALASFAPRLASLPWRSTEGRIQVARILRSLPGNPAEYRMAAVRLQFGPSPNGTEREELRRAWLEEVNACGGLSAEHKDHVAAYFQQQAEHELVAELISAPEALTESTLYRRRVESLLELGRWREVGVMGSDSGAPLLPESRLLMQSLAVLHKPGPKTCMADRLLADAFNESREEKRASACFATGCAALDHHLPVLASQAFATALDLAKNRHGLMESIINQTRTSNLSITQLIRSMEGSSTMHDETVQNQLIYLHLLADRDLDAMNDLIRQRRTSLPDDVYLKFLDAFATNKRGEFTQAAKMLVPLPRYRWHQGEAAVIASIIAASGNFDRSASLLGQIDTTKLFPQEQALVLPWQQRISNGSQLVSTLVSDPVE